MRWHMQWMGLLLLATAVLMTGCGSPEPEAEQAAPAETAAPPPEPEPLEQEPAGEAAEEKAEPKEETRKASPPDEDAVTARNVWVPGKEGKLLMGLDGGEYAPYRAGVIKETQRALQAQGFYSGPVHGYLDEPTMEALGEFQRRNNLQVCGVPAPRTRDALFAEREASAKAA